MKKNVLLLGALALGTMLKAQTSIETYRLDYGSTKGENGTTGLYNGWATANRNAQENGAVQFNGQNHLSLGNPSIDATNGFTISFWYYPSSAMMGTNNFVLSKRASCSTGNQLNIVHNATANTLSCYTRVDSPSPAFTTGVVVNVTADTWQHITFVFDNANRRALGYVNGTLGNFAGYSGTSGVVKEFAPSTDLMLATSPCVGVDGSLRFQGKLDDVKLFSVTLTSTDVATNYNEVVPDPVTPPSKSLNSLLVYSDPMDIKCANNPNPPVLIGATSTTNRAGASNSAILFNGSSSAADYTRVSASNPLKDLVANSSSIAISAWVKVTGTEANGFIVSNYAGTNACGITGAQRGIVLRIMDNKLNAFVTLNTGQFQTTSDVAIPVNEWHHVGMNFKQPFTSASDIELFIDGTKVASTPISGSTLTANGIFVESSTIPTAFGGALTTTNTVCNTAYSLLGAIDDVKIFKDTLSNSQMASLFQEASTPYVAVGDTSSAIVLRESFNYSDSLAFANKYMGKYSGIKFVADRFGNTKKAVRFNASNAYINAAPNISNVVADQDPFSYSVWIKPEDLMTNNMIFGHTGDAGCGENQRQQYFRILDGKVNFTAVFVPSSAGSYRNVSGNTLLQIGTWYHVVVNVNQPISTNNDIEIYLNGVKETLTVTTAGTSTGSLPINTSRLGFGNYLSIAGLPCNTATDASFKGVLDDIRIYDRFLCVEDVTALYNAQPPIVTSEEESYLNQASVLLYPNPVEGDYVHLTRSGQWTLSSAMGEELAKGNTASIEVLSLARGLYVLRLTTEEGVITSSFIKK